jgi:hypothetical protein
LTQACAGRSIPPWEHGKIPHDYLRLSLFGFAAQLVVVIRRMKGQFDEIDPCTFTDPVA